MARKNSSVCDLRLRDVTPYVGAIILFFSITGYLGGYIIIDLSARRRQLAETDLFRTPSVVHANGRVQGQGHSDDEHPVEGLASVQQFKDLNVKCNAACLRRTQNDGQWIDWSAHSFQLFAYSAIFDDRSSLDLDATVTAGLVRIIAVSSVLSEKETDKGVRLPSDLTCHLCYEDGSSVISQLERDPKAVGYGWFVNGSPVREYIFTCPCPAGKRPMSVSLKRSTTQHADVSCLPVEVPEKPGEKRRLAICAEVIHELPDPYQLIEWLEIQRLLGVSNVFFYTMSNVNKESKGYNVMSYYSSTRANNFVRLRNTSRLGVTSDTQQYALLNSPIINDCVYRNMYNYRYIMAIDIREVIVPQRTSATLLDMLAYFEQVYAQRLPSNYVFWNAYHFTDWSPDVDTSPLLTILKYRRQSPLSDYGQNIKSIVDPETCVNMHNQYCWGVTPRVAKTGQPYMEIISPKIAVKQSFRKCEYESVKCTALLANSTLDNSFDTFRATLLQTISDSVLNLLDHKM